MGVNLCIQDLSRNDHPAWDFLRYAGDKEFCRIDLPTTIHGEDSDLQRPVDFEAWHEAVKAIDHWNPRRWHNLLQILETDPDYYIYMSW